MNKFAVVAGVLVPAFLLVVAASPAWAQDKKAETKAVPADKAKPQPPAAQAKAGTGTTKVIVDNEKVNVIEVRYKPGEASEMRERPPRVVRALTDGTMERTYPDGKKETVKWTAGEVKYFPKDNFANKNIGKKEMVLFVTNLK